MISIPTSRLALAVLLLAAGWRQPLAAAEANFVAGWADGSRTSADEVLDWNRLDARPTLAGRPLLDAKNPVCWLRDTRVEANPRPAPIVEFVGGDRLPGRVVGWAEHFTTDGSPTCLLVAPAIDIDLPGQKREQIGVRLDLVRRVVWQPQTTGAVPPGTLVLADGRRVTFRAIRWQPHTLEVLTDLQPAHYTFDELAELHLPAADAWDAQLRTLALLSSDVTERLMRLETAGGLRLTTSLARFQARSVGGDAPEKWFHLVQPAWLEETLCLAHRQVSMRTFAAPRELPLSWLPPTASRHRGTFSVSWTAALADRNVQGGALRAGGQPFGWGFGTHAEHELTFQLPASARSFRTLVGLDQLASSGGCARGRVVLGGKPRFATSLLVGSGKPADSGVLPLAAGGPRDLLLVSDAAAADRPPGADPFDIRDLVDWLEPVVGFDPVELRREIARTADRALSGAEGWSADAVAAGNWRVVNRFSAADLAHPRFRTLVALDAPLTLSRRLRIDPGQTRARLLVGRPPRASGRPTLEISLDGRRLGRQEVPMLGEAGEPRPIDVPLPGYAGPVEFAVRLDPAGKPTEIDWRGVILLDDSAASPAP